MLQAPAGRGKSKVQYICTAKSSPALGLAVMGTCDCAKLLAQAK